MNTLHYLYLVERNVSTTPVSLAVFRTQQAAVRFRDLQRIPDPRITELAPGVLPWPIVQEHINLQTAKPHPLVSENGGDQHVMVDPFVAMSEAGLVLYHVERNEAGTVTRVEPAFQRTRCPHYKVPGTVHEVSTTDDGRRLHLFAQDDEALRWRLQELGMTVAALR